MGPILETHLLQSLIKIRRDCSHTDSWLLYKYGPDPTSAEAPPTLNFCGRGDVLPTLECRVEGFPSEKELQLVIVPKPKGIEAEVSRRQHTRQPHNLVHRRPHIIPGAEFRVLMTRFTTTPTASVAAACRCCCYRCRCFYFCCCCCCCCCCYYYYYYYYLLQLLLLLIRAPSCNIAFYPRCRSHRHGDAPGRCEHLELSEGADLRVAWRHAKFGWEVREALNLKP